MSPSRQKELKFLLAAGTPLPVIETRQALFIEQNDNTFDDFYTLLELVQQEVLDFVSKKQRKVFFRARFRVSLFLSSVVVVFDKGDVFDVNLGTQGKKELEQWLEDQTTP